MRVVIGLPLYQANDICPLTQQCLQEAEAYNKQQDLIYFEIRKVTGTSSVFARNFCAGAMCEKTKQKLNYDYFLSIDGDMAFSVNSILRLIRRYEEIKAGVGKDIGILGGAYTSRGARNAGRLVAGGWGSTVGIAPEEFWLPYWMDLHALKVDWCGTGFMLIPKDVLEALEYPWFRSYVIDRGDESSLTTEDLSICMDVKSKLNRSVWVDCTNRIAHIPH